MAAARTRTSGRTAQFPGSPPAIGNQPSVSMGGCELSAALHDGVRMLIDRAGLLIPFVMLKACGRWLGARFSIECGQRWP
jgi:hypothetical protein